jgi:DNA excision repair protein ERCC-2
MIIKLGPIFIRYPFEEIYPEQIQIIFILQKLWKENGNGIIGIPPGIDLPPAVLSFFLSYKFDYDYRVRLLYVTEMIPETERILLKFKNFSAKKDENHLSNKKLNFLASSYIEKAKLCINSNFKDELKKEEIEDFCLSLILPENYKKKSTFKTNSKVKKLSKGHQICGFYENFLKKKFKKRPGLWTIKNIRKEAFLKQICPFFLSREIFFESHVNLLNFEQFFSPGVFKKDMKKILKTSFLILDNGKNIDTIFTKLSVSQLNSSILLDSIRGLLYLKNFFLSTSSIKILHSKKKYVRRKLINLDQNKPFFFENDLPVFLGYFTSNPYKNLNLRNFANFFVILKKIIDLLHIILRDKPNVDISIDQFFSSLSNGLKEYHFNTEFLVHANEYLLTMSFGARILNYRYLIGLKYLMWFFKKLGILLDSNNENIRVIGIKNTTTKNIKIESFLFLCCFELPVFTRLIFENTLSFLFLTTQNSFLFSNLSILDQNNIYFGNLKPVFKKSCIFNEKLLFGENILFSNSNKFFQEKSFLLKKIISLLIQISECSPNGIICIFSSNTILLEILEILNNSDTLKQIKNMRNIFIESLQFDLNLKIIEKFKICCDLGLKSIFFGLSSGIINNIYLKNYYSRLILNIQSKPLYLDKFKKVLYYWRKIPSNRLYSPNLTENVRELSNNLILRKLIGSKKDYRIFLNIKQISEFEKNYNTFNPETIKHQEMMKDGKFDIYSRIDQFLSCYSNFNIGI